MTSDVSLWGHELNFYLHYNTTYKLPFTCSFLSRDFLRRKIGLMVHQELPIEDLHRAQFGQIYRSEKVHTTSMRSNSTGSTW